MSSSGLVAAVGRSLARLLLPKFSVHEALSIAGVGNPVMRCRYKLNADFPLSLSHSGSKPGVAPPVFIDRPSI